MGSCLAVFQILNEQIEIEKFRKNITLRAKEVKQSQLAEFGIKSNITPARTILRYNERNSNGDIIRFDVEQESSERFDEIKVYKWDSAEEGIINATKDNDIRYKSGFKIVKDFIMEMDISKKLLYVYENKKNSGLLAHRINKNEILCVKPRDIDIESVSKREEVLDTWGVWIDNSSEGTKKGLFGNPKIKKGEKASSFHFIWQIMEEERLTSISLNISVHGRLSSNNVIVTKQLLKQVFDDIWEKQPKKDK